MYFDFLMGAQKTYTIDVIVDAINNIDIDQLSDAFCQVPDILEAKWVPPSQKKKK